MMQSEQKDGIVIEVTSDNNSINLSKKTELFENQSASNESKTSHWQKLKAANHRILPRKSTGEIKLANILNDLKKIAAEELDGIREDEQRLGKNPLKYMRLFRRHLIHFLRRPTFHYIIISLVMTDLIVVLMDLILGQLSSPCLTHDEMIQYNTTDQRDTCLLDHSTSLIHADLFLFYFSAILLLIFVLEVFITFYAFGWKYYLNPLYFLDSTIVLASFIMEIYFHYGNIGRAGRAAAAMVILRLWKIIRAIHAVAHSITLKNRLLINKIQEAKTLLEEEKQQTEQTLEKHEIKMEYFLKILANMGKLPSQDQIDAYVDNTLKIRKQNHAIIMET